MKRDTKKRVVVLFSKEREREEEEEEERDTYNHIWRLDSARKGRKGGATRSGKGFRRYVFVFF